MSAPLEFEIRERVAGYLSARVSLDEFEDWFVASTWDVHRLGEQDLRDLVFAVELCLSENSNGYLTEAELRDRLRTVLQTVASGR